MQEGAMKLYIGNKNYSSWSLRPWLLMRHAGIEFEEVKLRLDFSQGSAFRRQLLAVAPIAKVPVLVDDGLVIWDTLAIAEYLAEKFPHLNLWPQGRAARATARSLCAEMHAGFAALRNHFPMNIEASLPDVGAKVLREQPEVVRDVARIGDMWSRALDDSGGPFLFGEFGVVDAYYAPVCTRLRTYGVALPERPQRYAQRMLELDAQRDWDDAAKSEADFLQSDEPYRSERR
ncbi:MAG: glutathione S-transferase family protein [Burkholderiaceae bacterium]|nr:glutathione S-transferase family protein [Burkholderiaceae bacterium]